MIRLCKKEEFDDLVEILRLSFEKASIDKKIEDMFGNLIGIPWWKRKSIDVRNEFYLNPDGVFVKIIEGKIVGFITTIISKESNTGRIQTLAIHPNYQRKGIGTELINHALKYFKKEGLKLARIDVKESNISAFELYKKLGFKEVARQINLAMKIEK
jgi:ribosomal protein S18 acetylase RimI-like enzyme